MPPDIPCVQDGCQRAVDSKMSMQRRVLRKYLADSGLTKVVKTGGRQYTQHNDSVLVEAIAEAIELLEFRRKVEKKMHFDLIMHDPDPLSRIIAKQQRDQAVIEADDAEHRQTAKRRDARSMAAAWNKLQGSAADEYDSRESAKAAGSKEEWSCRHDKNECVPSRDTNRGTAPKANR